MGEARKRGSFEQRKIKAEAKREELDRIRSEQEERERKATDAELQKLKSVERPGPPKRPTHSAFGRRWAQVAIRRAYVAAMLAEQEPGREL